MTRRFGRYTLVQRLATGGMAEIWFARQRALPNFARPVVLKLILGPLAGDDHVVRMFLDEARISALLTHPNAVQIYDVGVEDDTFFIAMEYIEGENLFEIWRRCAERSQPMPHSFAARIVSDACKALHHAHELRSPRGEPLNLVHRDISLNNILVSYEGHTKVVDFGLAKTKMRAEVTLPGILKGRKAYMSPEQFSGEALDRRSDLFSLGVVLYELCTRQRLFRDGALDSGAEQTTSVPIQPEGVMRTIERGEIILPSKVATIDPKLERIIMRALERDVRLRYQTAEELSIALEDYLRGDPASTADIGARMHELFAEELADKRRLLELIAKPEPGELEEEVATAEASRSDTVIESRPARRKPRAEEDRGTRQMLLAAGAMALLIVGVAIGLMLAPRSSAPGTPAAPLAREVPKPTTYGKATISSRPSGAWILVDGKPVSTESGRPAVTPAEVTMLEHDRVYTISVVKDSFEPWSKVIVAGPDTERSVINADLTPLMGKVTAAISGDRSGRVEVLIGGRSLGSGSAKLSGFVPAGGGIRVETRAPPGTECVASPRIADVHPDRTAQINVACNTALPPSVADPLPPPAAGTDCRPAPGLQPGYITVSSTPWANVFHQGRKIGDTPLSRYKLPAGCAELELVTQDGRSKKLRIRVETGKVNIYKVDLTR